MDTEKIYCYDKPTDNSALYALMNGNNNWNNNPFIYLVWMMFANRMWGNNGESNAQLSQLQNQMSDNQNSNMLMDAIRGNGNAITTLASNLNCDFNTLNTAICGVRSAIQEVAGQVGYSSERVINAVNMGDCNVIQALKDCCCGTQKEILKMGYENQLANERQTTAFLGRIDQLANGVQSGFSQVGYATQAQTCALNDAIRTATQTLSDKLDAHWTQELQIKYQDAKAELSQTAQTSALTVQLNAIAAAIAKIPTT